MRHSLALRVCWGGGGRGVRAQSTSRSFVGTSPARGGGGDLRLGLRWQLKQVLSAYAPICAKLGEMGEVGQGRGVHPHACLLGLARVAFGGLGR